MAINLFIPALSGRFLFPGICIWYAGCGNMNNTGQNLCALQLWQPFRFSKGGVFISAQYRAREAAMEKMIRSL